MRTFGSQTINVLDLVSRDPNGQLWITDTTLDGCKVIGPAVLIFRPEDDVAFDSNTMGMQMFWPLYETGRSYVGGIGLWRVRFHKCSFEDVGIAAHTDLIDQFLGG